MKWINRNYISLLIFPKSIFLKLVYFSNSKSPQSHQNLRDRTGNLKQTLACVQDDSV